MSKLKLGDFKRIGEPGSFQHYFSHKLPNGNEICLEACMSGYCVGLYDKNQELLKDKVCTNIDNMAEMQIMPGFSMGSGGALKKAIEIANTL